MNVSLVKNAFLSYQECEEEMREEYSMIKPFSFFLLNFMILTSIVNERQFMLGHSYFAKRASSAYKSCIILQKIL